MIVTIDGPAGSGKSTAARKLAARLQIPYLDTGAMYRAIAYECVRRGVDLRDESTVAAVARRARLDLDCGPTHTRIRIDGVDVSELIRSMEVSGATSQIAKMQPVRDILVRQQRDIGARLESLVTEGRDQGSVVFPHADVKFVLVASLARRAQRRFEEMIGAGEPVTVQLVEQNLSARDAVDARQWEPLLSAGTAIVIDTSAMSIQDVVDHLVAQVQGDRAATTGKLRTSRPS
jgi:cytidylate kinase